MTDEQRRREHSGAVAAHHSRMSSTVTAPVAATGRVCRSNIHEAPVPAVTVGTFDMNDTQHVAEPDSAYCLKCAVMLHDIGWFTPTDGTALPTLREFVTTHDPRTGEPR